MDCNGIGVFRMTSKIIYLFIYLLEKRSKAR